MLILDSIIAKKMRERIPARLDGDPAFRYPSPEKWGAKCLPFSFQSTYKLVGGRYFYGEAPYKAVVIFFHGMGAGRNAYSQEIAALAKQGYLVYAYDNSGCMESQGIVKHGIIQNLVDQENFFKWLDVDPMAKGYRRYAIGHSWGGNAALCALREQYHVDKVVSFAGFDHASVQAGAKMEKTLRGYFARRYKDLGKLDGLELMKNTDKKVLYISGDKDKVVDVDNNYFRFQKALKDKKNIEFYLVKGRYHQPYWTIDAQNYFLDLLKQGVTKSTLDHAVDIDYDRLQQDDPLVMKRVFDFFSS